MDFDYEIVRSKRKTVGISVNIDGRVIVRAPLRQSERSIIEIVGQNRKWIENNIEKQKMRRAIV